MPNNNDSFDLITFCESQLRNSNNSQTREVIQGIIENDQLNYITLFGLLEKIVYENCSKYQGTNQSADLMLQVMMILKPIKDNLLNEQESNNTEIVINND